MKNCSIKFKIDEDGYLLVSCDNGCTWENIGKVVGNASVVPGPQGPEGPQGPSGQDGVDGVDGADGLTPFINETTGTWWIGDTDTEVVAAGTNGEVDVEGSSDIGVVGTPSVTKRVEGNKTILQFHELKGERGDAPTITAVRSEETGTIVFYVDGTAVATLYDNVHRPIEVNSQQILGNDLTALNLVAGTNISLSSSDGSVVINAILPDSVIFRGSLGTGGTITTLPVDGTASIGDEYKVITDGTYAGQAAKNGDLFICNTKTEVTNGWVHIPSGDEPSGTVTSVSTGTGLSGGPITDSGTISHADTSNQSSVTNSGNTFIQSVTLDDMGHVTGLSSASSNVPTVNDGALSIVAKSQNETTVASFSANQSGNSQLILEAGAGITFTPNSSTNTLKISSVISVGSLLINGLHAQYLNPNFSNQGHRCEVDNYTRIVASRSKNYAKMSFMFEIIGIEREGVHYYAKYYFDGRGTDRALYCLEYYGNDLTYFHPLDSIWFTYEGNSRSGILNIYRKCLENSIDDVFIVNVLMENTNGPKTRNEVLYGTGDTGYSIQFWANYNDEHFQGSGTDIYGYDNNIYEADIKATATLVQATLPPYTLDTLPSSSV